MNRRRKVEASMTRIASAASRPNVIVIVTDDQDDIVSLSTMTHVQTHLINQGCRFLNSFVALPVCGPSRGSFFTGQYSHNSGMGGSGNTYRGYKRVKRHTLPVWMQAAGYTTAMIGKFINGYGDNDTALEIPPGWNEWHSLVTGGGYFDNVLNENGKLVAYGDDPEDYITDVLSAKASSFIASAQQPFFMVVAPTAPHEEGAAAVPAPRDAGTFAALPFPSRPSFNEADVSDKPAFVQATPLLTAAEINEITSDFRKRQEALIAVDKMVDDMMAALTARAGVLANTVVIYTADNGFLQGEHRLRGKGAAYEEAIRVPLIMRGPNIPVNTTRSQLVVNVDLTATILDWAETVPTNVPDGRSLVPVLASAGALWRSTLLVSEGSGDDAFWLARTATAAYIEHLTGEKEFYDLATDPYQLSNKINDGAHAATIATLTARLATLKTCAGNTCWIA